LRRRGVRLARNARGKSAGCVGFYCIIAAATVVGLALGYTPIDPIQMLIWSAVLNGIVAVPIMTVMMVVVTRLSVMGRFSARPTLTFSDGLAQR
jgi:Mn2+/Fe2+ NRAMP family transporter